MSKPAKPNGGQAAGIVLLAVSCLNIGYGLAKLVNGLDGGGTLMAIGLAMVGVSVTLLMRGSKPSAE